MFKITLIGIAPKNVYTELIDVFLRPDEYVCIGDGETDERPDAEYAHRLSFNGSDYANQRNQIKRQMYRLLSELTGKTPEWGILTGIRPVKVAGELIKKEGSREKARQLLVGYFFLSLGKAEQVLDMFEHQNRLVGEAKKNSAGIYIGIPFCPSRCLYCSFTSNQGTEAQIQDYLDALHKEIEYTGLEMSALNMYPESVYLGGGTPTSISASQLDALLCKIENTFDLKDCVEITVEAGRPDTITKEKLAIIKQHNINRISINPQSMKDATLALIGRNHSAEDIRNAFSLARTAGIEIINADIIAGLPGETPQDFQDTLNQVIGLGAENITVHTLAVKRASRLKDLDSQFHHKQEVAVVEMLKISELLLDASGYRPYYLYRQKHMAGGLENVGYCKGDTDGIYNMRIMDEHQTIIALGAGGITKVYFPDEDRLERVPNVSNFEIYVERIEEMINRKREHLF